VILRKDAVPPPPPPPLLKPDRHRHIQPLLHSSLGLFNTHSMPRSQSPPRGPRRRSPSPRRDGERDRREPRPRSRSRSPPSRSAPPRRPKELSFYKKSSSSVGSFSHRRDPLDDMQAESARDRMERRDRGEVPARFGGTREQGVRNTMSSTAPSGAAPSGMGSFRRGDDPLDRMPVRGGEDYRGEERSTGSQRDYDRARELDRRKKGDRDREERLANMDKPGARPTAPAGVPSL
jgi:ubiquitin-like protein 5